MIGLMFLLLLNSFAYIALKAFQQLNVQHDRYLSVPPATMGMAFCEVLAVVKVSQHATFWAAVPIGLGGILGCWFAMWFHKFMRGRNVRHP